MVRSRADLVETATLMLKLGFVAFGGPAAHIAMLEDEVVERRRWMSRQHFLDLVGATSLVPGPNSTEMMMHIGYERGGWPGLLISGALFVLPAAVITGVLAFLYVTFGTAPQLESLLWGVKPAVLVIILAATWKLGRKAMKSWREAVIGLAVAVAVLMGVNELLALFVGAFLGTAWLMVTRGLFTDGNLLLLPILASVGVMADPATETVPVTLKALGLFFLKVGAVLYGSGYVLVAFLEGDLVERFGWLTSEQLLDAIAIGQMTPGPVLTTATFVGYLLLGVPGAAVATVAIFFPSLVFVGLLNPWVPKLRTRPWTGAFLDSVNAAALALMATVIVKLGLVTLVSWQAWVLVAVSAVALFRFRVHSAWLVLGAGLLGFLMSRLWPIA